MNIKELIYRAHLNKKGDYEITQTGGVAKRGVDRWIFKYLNPEKSFNGEMIIEKEYLLNFNKDSTAVFLHLLPE